MEVGAEPWKPDSPISGTHKFGRRHSFFAYPSTLSLSWCVSVCEREREEMASMAATSSMVIVRSDASSNLKQYSGFSSDLLGVLHFFPLISACF